MFPDMDWPTLPVSYGPYDDVTFQFLNGQQTQHNITTAPGSRVELSVTSYFAYYKGNVPVYNQHVRFQGTEGIATHMFVYDTAANQTNPVVMEDDRAAFRTWTKLYVGFELFKWSILVFWRTFSLYFKEQFAARTLMLCEIIAKVVQ